MKQYRQKPQAAPRKAYTGIEAPKPRRKATAAPPAAEREERDPIDYGPLSGWIGFNLRMAQTASFSAFAREAQDVGLRPGRFALLMLIGRNPGTGQTALSRANGRDKSTLTPALNDLVRRGLVDRQRVKDDRRAYRLSLTPAGKAMLRRLTACAERHEVNLDRIVGKRDRILFLEILRRLAAALS